MKYDEVVSWMEEKGTEQNKKIYRNHGCDIDLYGVSTKYTKEIRKKIKNDRNIGLALFKSDNADLITLSQGIVEIDDIKDEDIHRVIELTSYYMILEYVLPYILIHDKARTTTFILKYLHCDKIKYRQVAYSLLALYFHYYDEIEGLDLDNEKHYINENIHNEANRVKYTMNSLLISVGVYCEKYTEEVLTIADNVKTIKVDMGNTSCKVPSIVTYIEKNKERNKIGV